MLIHKTTKQNKLDKQKHIAKPIHNPAGLRQSNQVWQSSHWGGPILSKAQSLWTESIFLPVLIQWKQNKADSNSINKLNRAEPNGLYAGKMREQASEVFERGGEKEGQIT